MPDASHKKNTSATIPETKDNILSGLARDWSNMQNSQIGEMSTNQSSKQDSDQVNGGQKRHLETVATYEVELRWRTIDDMYKLYWYTVHIHCMCVSENGRKDINITYLGNQS